MIVQASPSFEELILGHRHLVGRTVTQWWHVSGVRALGRDEAEGVGNEALCRAARDYDPAQGRFQPLAITYIRNSLLKVAAHEGRTERIENPDRLPERGGLARRRTDVGWVEDVLYSLEQADRSLLMRRFGLRGCPVETTAEIAASDGVTVRTVQARLKSALARARSTLGHERP